MYDRVYSKVYSSGTNCQHKARYNIDFRPTTFLYGYNIPQYFTFPPFQYKLIFQLKKEQKTLHADPVVTATGKRLNSAIALLAELLGSQWELRMWISAKTGLKFHICLYTCRVTPPPSEAQHQHKPLTVSYSVCVTLVRRTELCGPKQGVLSKKHAELVVRRKNKSQSDPLLAANSTIRYSYLTEHQPCLFVDTNYIQSQPHASLYIKLNVVVWKWLQVNRDIRLLNTTWTSVDSSTFSCSFNLDTIKQVFST